MRSIMPFLPAAMLQASLNMRAKDLVGSISSQSPCGTALTTLPDLAAEPDQQSIVWAPDAAGTNCALVTAPRVCRAGSAPAARRFGDRDPQLVVDHCRRVLTQASLARAGRARPALQSARRRAAPQQRPRW